ncbi:glycosyltransferase [Candidatus Uhrbacteria bacterium]|nr:glycosyltransferase [Candidatus Uhrbacteria bacterium]
MNVAILHNRFGANARGGAETWVRQFAGQRRGQGDIVTVIAADQYGAHCIKGIHPHPDDGASVQRLPVGNLVPYESVHRLPSIVRFAWHSIDWFNVVAAVRLAQWMRRQQIQELITNNLTGCGWLIRLAIRLSKQQIIWTHVLHDIQLLKPSGLLLWGQEESWWYVGLPGRVYRSLTRVLVTPDKIIAPSHWVVSQHQRFGFFLNTDTHVSTAPNKSIRIDPPVHNPIRILFVGQLEPHKGIAVLFKVLATLEFPYRMTMIGAGSLQGAARNQARLREGWDILGSQPPDAVQSALIASDVLVFPSICYENTPMILQEAMGAGITIIASNIGGVPELLLHYPKKILVEPGSAPALAAALVGFSRRRSATP